MVYKEVASLDLKGNPFSFTINPALLVGLEQETHSLEKSLVQEKFTLLVGPSGSGKTSLLKSLQANSPQLNVIYLPKPPKNPQDWLIILKGLVKGEEATLYTLGDLLNSCLEETCYLFVDEAHEASKDSLEWLRAIADQANVSVILSGTSDLDLRLSNGLESLGNRITSRIEVNKLTLPQTRELVKKRIESCGGKDIEPFTSETLEYIHAQANGIPREMLKLCSSLMSQALEQGLSTVDIRFLKRPVSGEERIQELSQKQKALLAKLAESPLTPKQLAEYTTSYYKDLSTATRAINNILKRLLEEGHVERSKIGKSFSYSLAPRLKAMMVAQKAANPAQI